MNDPIDVLGVHPNGAVARRPDDRDYQYGSKEIAEAPAPFNWNQGYDVEQDISDVLMTGFKLPTKDQGSAGSCGGEAISAYGQAITSYFLRETAEKSAKAPYSQVYAPGGGSNDRDLANIYIKQGIYKESFVPSYPSPGRAPTESFMERSNDITPAARIDAAKENALLAYSFPSINIDTIAQVIRDCKGVMIGLHGTNNGTWLSEFPKPPAHGDDLWAHYMYFGKAFVEHGKKYIWGKQSWGAGVGVGGWQKIGADYFASGSIWSAMALLVNDKPLTPPSYKFLHDINMGESSTEVFNLQQALAYDGTFNLAPTGHYGPVTAHAVLAFQIKYNLAPLATLNELGGHVVGPATRMKLNSLT